jgi:putative methanogenesis marker protein 8
MGNHEIEALGKSKIIIKNGKVVSVEDPIIDYCPLFDKYRGIKKLTKESIKENIEFRIQDFGMCTEDRKFPSHDFLSIGASEIMSTLLKKGLLDATVIVCDGCGTVVVADPDKVEGLAGRISGVIKTSPIKNVISFVGISNVLDSESCEINQIKGLKMAISNGFKNIAITISNAKDILEIRNIEKINSCNILIFGVHTTGASRDDAAIFMEYGDIITACMSEEIKGIGDKKNIYKTKTKIPIYAPSEKGKNAIELRLKEIEKKN